MNRLFHFDAKLSELSMTQFKLFVGPSGGIEVGYFLLGASLAKLAMMKRCTNPSFIAISILNCAEHLLTVSASSTTVAGEETWSLAQLKCLNDECNGLLMLGT